MFLLLGCLTSQTEYDALLARAQDADQDGMAALAYGGTDCDDTDPLVNPVASEVCDGVDNDCNGLVDDAPRDPLTWFLDGDGDGFGDDGRTAEGCEAPAAHVGVGGDCDDNRVEVNPAEEEVCDDGLDNDCSGDSPECRLEGAYLLSSSDMTWTGASDGYFGVDAKPLDYDGDGELELAVLELSKNGQGVVYLYETARSPDSDADDAVWRRETREDIEDLSQPLGSVDLGQDGAEDLVLGLPEAVEVFEGRSDRTPSETPSTTLRPTSAGQGFGIYIFAAGTSVSEPNNGVGVFEFDNSDLSFEAGAAYVWFGERETEENTTTADLVIRGQAGDNLGDSGAFAQADLNGDGQMDYFLGASRQDRAYLWYDASSSSEVLAVDADLLLHSESAETFFGGTVEAGDLNGDGYSDLLVAEPRFSTELLSDVGAVHVFSGTAEGLRGTLTSEQADLQILGSDAQMFAGGSLWVGDLNNDTQADLVMGGWQVYGDAFGFYGPLTGDSVVSKAEISIDGTNGGFCAYTLEIADINADGNQDIVIPCPGTGGGQVRALLGIGP